jgi:N-acetyl-anhydromuramyl-L-alanine amidase AmpD
MRRSVVAVSVIVTCSLLWGASAETTQKKPSAKKTASAKSPSKRKPGSKASSKKGKTSTKFSPRQTQPDAARSREIQEALQKQGYLKTEPSGKWDKATTDALSKFQQAHGRKPTGKPDAHSLQDMGLGAKYENLVEQ